MSDYGASVISVVEGAQPPPGAESSALAADRGGAVTTGGTGNVYTAATRTVLGQLGPGTSLLLKIDRRNTGAAFLGVDGHAQRPWLDRGLRPLVEGALQPGAFVPATYDDVADVFVSDVSSVPDVAGLPAELERLEDAIQIGGAAVAAGLRDGVRPEADTLAKIAALIDALVTALAGKATPADITAAIAKLTTGAPQQLDTFLEAYNRFLADESALSALTQIVAGKATPQDVTTAVQGAVSALNQSLDTEAATRAAADVALTAALNAVARRGLYSGVRPGDNPDVYTSTLAGGDLAGLPTLAPEAYPIRAVADGLGIALSAGREVWERAYHAVGRDRLWRLRWRYVRTLDADGIDDERVGALVQWYDVNRKPVGSPVVAEMFSPRATQPAHEFGAFVGADGLVGVTLTAPPGAAYFRVGLKSYGAVPVTVLTDLGARDVSDVAAAILRLVPGDAVPALGARLDNVVGDLTTEQARAKAAEAATDLRTVEVQPRPAGTVPLWSLGDQLDAVLRTFLRATQQGDIALGTRLRLPRLPKWFGGVVGGIFGSRGERFLEITRRAELRVLALRVARLPRAFGGTIGGVFGPRGERLLVVDERHDTHVRRLRLPRLTRAFGGAVGGIFGPRWERFLEVTRRGEVRVSVLRLPAVRDRAGAVLARTSDGRPILEILRSNRIRLNLDPTSYIAARVAARRDPKEVIALGGAGPVMDAHALPGPGQRMGFLSDVDGVWMPYVLRRDLPVLGPPLAMPWSTIEGQISYGQSWRALAALVDALTSAYEPRRAMLLGGISNGVLRQIPTIGTSDGINGVRTFYGLGPGSYIGIGAAAMMTRQRLRTAFNLPGGTIVDTNSSYPGARWDELRPGTNPWEIGVQQRAKAKEIAARYGATIDWRSAALTHEAAPNGRLDGNGNVIDYNAVLADVVASFDALNLNGIGGTRLKYYIDQTAPVSNATVAQDSILTQFKFAADSNGRVTCIGPRFPYGFSDVIHHTDRGTLEVGQLEGYVKFVELDRGIPWLGVRPTAITVSGAVVTIAMTRPEGMGDLMIDTKSINAAPQYGFHLRIDGAERTVESVSAGGDFVAFNLAQTIAKDTVCEVSHAFYGPGSPSGTHSGVWGNVKRPGPPSPLFLNTDIDAWPYVFRQNVTAT